MIKLSFAIAILVFSAVNAQPRPGMDFAACLSALTNLSPAFTNTVETINGGDKNLILSDLKELVINFKAAASTCGVEIRDSPGVANPRQCDQDIGIVGSILKELVNQCGKAAEDQNVFAVISEVMGLGNQLPRAIRDCGPLGQ